MLRHSKLYLWFMDVAYWLACYTAVFFTAFKILFFWRYPISDWKHFKIWVDAVHHTNCTYHYLFWEKHMRKFYIKIHILRREMEDYNKDVVGWMDEDPKKKPVPAPRKELTWRDTVL